ncbi:DUF924 family protein [Phenylobacterium sp.]|uniref:DUF924 family protein n=1 Tax=Phenylobacterium sp. TaxID=1871053 RepID=UPI002FC946C0
MAAAPQDVTGFWRTAGPRKWYAKDAKFDAAIALKFEPVHHAAARGEYDGWATSADGALALLILFDQFPRNLFRGSPHAFATDGRARQVARTAVNAGHDRAIDPQLRQFFYMPFEHSEDLADQDEAVRLFTLVRDETGDAESLKWAVIHRDIIARFGRFPHRNASLGRITTPAEQAFLDDGGFAG